MTFLFALPMQVVWFVYLLALWPGLMSPDSVIQWNQALYGPITDLHPAFSTLLIRLIAMIHPTPALVAFAQIIALSLTAGAVLAQFDKIGLPRWVSGLTAVIFAFSPVNSLLVNTLWKDIPFSIAFLGLMLLLFKIIISQGAWLSSAWNVLLLALVAFCVAIFRHNGPPDSFGLLLLLPFAYRKFARRILVSLLLSIALWWGIRGPVYDLLGITRLNSFFIYNHELFQIAAHINNGTKLEPSEAAFLTQILPLKDGWLYDCYSSSTIIYDPRLNHQFAIAHQSELHRVFIKISLRQPLVNVKHVLCTSSLVWKIADQSNHLSTIPLYYDNGRWSTIAYVYKQNNLSFSPKLTWLSQPLLNFVANTDDPAWIWLIWRPALYLYFSIVIVYLAVRRFQLRNLYLLLIPILIHSLLTMVSISNQDFRYQYPVYVFALLFWPLMCFKQPLKTQP